MVGNLTMCTNRPCDPPTIASNRFFQEKGEEEREQELSLSLLVLERVFSHIYNLATRLLSNHPRLCFLS